MKIAVITCYAQPDYVRARTLRAALKDIPGVTTIIVKNSHRGLWRYVEVYRKLRAVKKQQNPDLYLLTFRGQEILPLVLALAGNKPVWFDEFIIPIAYATAEHHHKTLATRVKYLLAELSEPLYRRWLARCAAILSDTQVHAELSARISHMNLSKYTSVPVGTDEELFKPGPKHASNEAFRIFYYSLGMQPLHGIPVVLTAAELLKDQPQIEFLIVGGKKPLQRAVAEAQDHGAHVVYKPWIEFNELMNTIRDSAICLGGPFGGTQQARHVITGKTYQFLACEVPVIVGESEATNEYFRDKDNALVVGQDDPEALANSILWARKHPEQLAQIAANGRSTFEKQFSISAIRRILQTLVSNS